MSHYYALFFGYGTALGLWFLFNNYFSHLWSHKQVEFEKPAREFGYAVLAGLLVLAVGQLYMNDLLIPKVPAFGLLIESFNQVLIFSPMLLLLWIRKQGPETAWLPVKDVGRRMALGVIMALVAMALFLAVRSESLPYLEVLSRLLSLQNLPYLVQVFLEDLTIAILFVRLRVWVGTHWSIAIVAVLFAAGHIPAMIAAGVSLSGFSSLILDTALGMSVLIVLHRAKDIWWFVWIHFVMDMMQYYSVA